MIADPSHSIIYFYFFLGGRGGGGEMQVTGI
jgi:hypothetical protein